MVIVSKVFIAVLAIGLLWGPIAQANKANNNPQAFVAQAFSGAAPQAQMLWLDEPRKKAYKRIIGRKAPMRVRYWRKGGKTVWVLEQIGKYKPITTGIVIDNNAIAQLKVLVYRESHGWEIKYPFFTNQFIGATLADMTASKRNKNIDGIAGATLSVRAMVQLATLALTLHAAVDNDAK